MRMLHSHRGCWINGFAPTLGHVLFLIPGLQFCLPELHQWSSSNLRVWAPQNQTLLICQCHLLLSCQVCWGFYTFTEWELQGAGARARTGTTLPVLVLNSDRLKTQFRENSWNQHPKELWGVVGVALGCGSRNQAPVAISSWINSLLSRALCDVNVQDVVTSFCITTLCCCDLVGCIPKTKLFLWTDLLWGGCGF